MTAKQAAEYVGRTGRLSVRGSSAPHWSHGEQGLVVTVKVLDAREVYGRLDLFVAPVAGSGAAWVEARRVTLDPPGASRPLVNPLTDTVF